MSVETKPVVEEGDDHDRGRQVVIGRRPWMVSTIVLMAQGVGLATIVGWNGSEFFRVIPVALVVAIVVAAAWVIRRAGQGGRGATLLLTGIVGVAAGLGVGGVYLAKVGLSVMTAAGIVVSIAGVVLLVSGAATLIRSIRGWWRLLAVPAGIALLVFVLFPLTLAVNATNRPRTPHGTTTPADRGFGYRDVAFTTTDGVQLSGWYIPSQNRAAVLLLHGAGSTRSSVLDHAVVLARHGYGTLLIDTRGHGSSGGDAMGFGWYGDLDVEAAVSFLDRQPDVDPTRIGVVGLSMGGEQAVAAAGVDGRLGAVVAEGVTGMQTADHGWLERYGWRGSIQLLIDRVAYGAAGALSGADRPLSLSEAIRSAAPRPVLLIAGGDEADEGIAARWFAEASPDSVDDWIVPGARHTGGLAARPAVWESRVIGFLDAALTPSPMDEAA